jgi:hypothetical protein
MLRKQLMQYPSLQLSSEAENVTQPYSQTDASTAVFNLAS